MRPEPRTFPPRPISLRTDQQSSSSHSNGNHSKKLFKRNTTPECMQKRQRLSNVTDSAQFRIRGTSLDANTGFGTQIQQQSSGARAMTTRDPNNFALAEQSSQSDSVVNSHPVDSSFSIDHTSFNQSKSLPHISSLDSSIQNPSRATYGFRDHFLPNFSIQDHMTAHRFRSFVYVDNYHYPPHQDMSPSRARGYGRGRDSFLSHMSIAAGNASSSGGDFSITGIIPSTLASAHTSHSSSFRDDETSTRPFSQTNFSAFLPDQACRIDPNEQVPIARHGPSSLRLQNDDTTAVGTSYESSHVRTELNSYSRSLSAPENTPSRLSTYFTAHSRRNRSENYNNYSSIHHPAARCTSLSSDLDGGYLGSSQRQMYSKEETPRGDRNTFHTSSNKQSNQHLSQSLFPCRNRVSSLTTASHNLAITPKENLDASDHLASSTLQSLGEQLPATSFKSGFEHSQSMSSTSVKTTTTDINTSSDSARVLVQKMQRKQGKTNQTSVTPTIEYRDVIVGEKASPTSEHEIGVDGVGASGHKGKNSSVKKKRKPRTSEQEDPSWEDQFEALCQFHEKTGHCIVPARYEENKRLGHWVMTQRRQHTLLIQGKQSALNEERVKRLESIGFVWKVRPDASESWSVMFEQMKAYKKKFGDCLVPQRYYPNPQLGTWVHTQRRHYKMRKDGKKSSMTEEKIQSLNSIGFVWSAKVPRKPTGREDGSEC